MSESKRRKVEYQCHYCDKSYKKPSKLEEHERSHTGERPFVCTFPGCDKAFIRSTHLAVHNKRHLNQRDFQCSFPDCTASFVTKQHLQRHEKSHTSPTVKCDYPGCIAEFSKRFQLRWHRASHEKETQTCSHCQTTFESLAALEKHIDRVHDNPIVYSCSSCDKKFAKWSELRKHVYNDHPIICTVCGKSYTKAYNLRQHIKEKHTEETKIPCEWPGCDSVLQTKRSYKTHTALVHEQDTQYKCELCDKGFPYKSLLIKHIGSHTPKSRTTSPKPKKSIIEEVTGFNHYNDTIAKYECPFAGCQFKFSNTYLLRRHLEGKQHMEDVESFKPDTLLLDNMSE